MSLEGRIHDTGEHLLGSLDHDPELQRRIHERVERRAQQRRQRAAAGLGAGVVVVLGGLVVLNVDRSDSSTGLASGSSASSLSSMLATTTAVIAPTTTLPTASSGGAARPPAEPSTTPPVPSTMVEPLGDGAPTLFTADSAGSWQLAIDLTTGLPAEVDHAAVAAETGGSAPPSGARFELRRSDPAGPDRCGQVPLDAADAAGAAIAGFPSWAKAMTTSLDGSTGLLQYATCPEPGTLAVDGETTQPIEWNLAWFRTGDPAAVLTPLSGSWGEPSDNGRYILLENDAGEPSVIVDTTSSTTHALLPDGCESPRQDSDAGYLIGDDGVVALAWCGGKASLVAGPVGAPQIVQTLESCGRNAALMVRDPAASSSESNWFAVVDHDNGSAWVIGPNVTTDAIPVGERVAWHPLGANAG